MGGAPSAVIVGCVVRGIEQLSPAYCACEIAAFKAEVGSIRQGPMYAGDTMASARLQAHSASPSACPRLADHSVKSVTVTSVREQTSQDG